MKKILTLLVIIIAFSSYSQITPFGNETNTYIRESLEKDKLIDDLGVNPLVVIDGKPLSSENLVTFKDLKSLEIDTISSIGKSSGTGEIIWGEIAKDGVILIKTNLVEYSDTMDSNTVRILFILDNKIISKEDAYAIDFSNDIQTVTVLKNSNKFIVLNNEEFEGIMILVSKVK